ncbi:MAG: hypothetical protein J0H74_05345 [Chitinophagaceae bacterium]|nr:hypothetical protein [Chitinophagaceae bacterium]
MKTLDFAAMENINGGAGPVTGLLGQLLAVPLSLLSTLGLGGLVTPLLNQVLGLIGGLGLPI